MTIPGIDLTGFDLARLDAARLESLLDRAAESAQEAVYITVGLGVLTFQRTQVRRRELNRRLDDLRRCLTPR